MNSGLKKIEIYDGKGKINMQLNIIFKCTKYLAVIVVIANCFMYSVVAQENNNSSNTGSSKTIGTREVLNLKNNKDQKNINESGGFFAEKNDILTLEIQSDISGGTVDLFLFSPEGKETKITIGNTNTTKNIALSEGQWSYNCTGFFQDGGNIQIVGTIN